MVRPPPETLIDLVGKTEAEHISKFVCNRLDEIIKYAPKDEAIALGMNYSKYYQIECMRMYEEKYLRL